MKRLQNCKIDFSTLTNARNIACKDTEYSAKAIDNVEKTDINGKKYLIPCLL
jgi:hypothetical protein